MIFLKYILLVILTLGHFCLFSQVQIGEAIIGTNVGDQCGNAVSMSADGNIVAIASVENVDNGIGAGHVRVFEWDGDNWIKVGWPLVGKKAQDKFGESISMSDDGLRLAVAAPSGGPKWIIGEVRVFEWDGDAWTQIGSDLAGVAQGDYFGFAISLSSDGSVMAISSQNDDDSGLVTLFNYDGNDWVQLGESIIGEAPDDRSGRISLSGDGQNIVIGASGNDGNGEDAGHVRVYELIDGKWIQKGMDINGVAADDRFGDNSISADGNIVAAGGVWNDTNGDESGHVLVYKWDGTTWVQYGQELLGEAAGDYFGHPISLSADGNTMAVGATNNDANGSSSGHVRLFSYTDSLWIQIGEDIDGEARGDFFGNGLSLSSQGNRVGIGAIFNDNGGNESGHARIFEVTQLETEIDNDGDGFIASEDCDDSNPAIYPNAVEVLDNDIDENCDGVAQKSVTPFEEMTIAQTVEGPWNFLVLYSEGHIVDSVEIILEGEVVYSREVNNSIASINLKDFLPNTYQVKITSGDQSLMKEVTLD